MLKHVIADEDNGIKALEDYTDFSCRVPAVMATRWHKGSVETMAPAATHGVKQSCAILAVVKVLLGICFRNDRWFIEIGRYYAAVLVAFEVIEVTCTPYQLSQPRIMKYSYSLLDWIVGEGDSICLLYGGL